jgi:hypothetical protein
MRTEPGNWYKLLWFGAIAIYVLVISATFGLLYEVLLFYISVLLVFLVIYLEGVIGVWSYLRLRRMLKEFISRQSPTEHTQHRIMLIVSPQPVAQQPRLKSNLPDTLSPVDSSSSSSVAAPINTINAATAATINNVKTSSSTIMASSITSVQQPVGTTSTTIRNGTIDTSHITKALRSLGIFIGCACFCMTIVTIGVVGASVKSLDPDVLGTPPTSYNWTQPFVTLPFILTQWVILWYSYEKRREASPSQPSRSNNHGEGGVGVGGKPGDGKKTPSIIIQCYHTTKKSNGIVCAT